MAKIAYVVPHSHARCVYVGGLFKCIYTWCRQIVHMMMTKTTTVQVDPLLCTLSVGVSNVYQCKAIALRKKHSVALSFCLNDSQKL